MSSSLKYKMNLQLCLKTKCLSQSEDWKKLWIYLPEMKRYFDDDHDLLNIIAYADILSKLQKIIWSNQMTLGTGFRHIGHVSDTLNQLFIHFSWKACLSEQFNTISFSLTFKFCRQIVQDPSVFYSTFVFAVIAVGTSRLSVSIKPPPLQAI